MNAGNDETVNLLCENHMANVIVDRFGRDIHTRLMDENYFEVKVDVEVSGNFLGWTIGIDGVKIVDPESVVEKMRKIRDRLIEYYKN